MGYFDALTSGYFKQGRSGNKLFFPWGPMGRGYVLASEQAYDRLRGQLKIYTIVMLTLIIVAAALQAYVWTLVIGAVLMAFYAVWALSITKGLPPSDERLTVRENMQTQALAHGNVSLWLLEGLSLLFVAGGIGLLIADPSSRILGMVTIVFFGACAAVFARMLILSRRVQR